MHPTTRQHYEWLIERENEEREKQHKTTNKNTKHNSQLTTQLKS